MKITTQGPNVIITGTSAKEGYQIVINTRRIMTNANGCLSIDMSQPDDIRHYVVVIVKRKLDGAEREVFIRCQDYSEAEMLSKFLVDHREKNLVPGSGRQLPWDKKSSPEAQAETKAEVEAEVKVEAEAEAETEAEAEAEVPKIELETTV